MSHQYPFSELHLVLGYRESRGGGSAKPDSTSLAQRLAKERNRVEQAQRKTLEQQLFAKSQVKSSISYGRRPSYYVRPAYNTPQYWRDFARGWITDDEHLDDYAAFDSRRRRALNSKYNKSAPPDRHQRAAPRETKQFSKPMSTQAARDDRLTPQSKALLQILVARTGRGRFTDTTKTTLGKIMNRCPRSIQRYIRELVKFGYLRTQVRKSRRTGFFIGLRVWIMNSVLPFYKQSDDRYDAALWLDFVTSRRKPEETKLSLTNYKNIIPNTLSPKKPPWFADYVY